MRRLTITSRLLGAAFCGLLVACSPARILPQDGFVQVPGGRVAFRVMGTGTAVPVLMIHGGPGGNSCGFASTMGGLAGVRPVVVYDQLGTGNSDRMTDLARDARLERFVAEVTEIRTRLGLTEVHLVGHSWGATVALEYLLTAKPAGVRSVSFVGPLLSTPVWIEDARALVQSLPAESRDAINAAIAAGKFDTPAFEAANKVFNNHFNARTVPSKERVAKEFGPCLSSPVRFHKGLYEHMWGPSEFVSTGTLRSYDRFDRLKELKLPTMFLVGEFDEARPATMLKFQAQVPGSVVKVIPNAAHAVPTDATKEFNDALAEFMASAEQR